MMNLITTYLFSVLAAYTVQQGATWYSMWSWSRVLKAAAWPIVAFRPLISSVQERHEETIARKGAE